MSDTQRFGVTLENKVQVWPQLIDAMREWVSDGIVVTVAKGREKRRDRQSRLSHVWKREASKHHGETDAETWGRWKLDILLPIKLADERTHDIAMREWSKIKSCGTLAGLNGGKDRDFRGVSARELEIEAAFDLCRSSDADISVRMFAEWLSDVQAQEAENGLVLICKNGLDDALMTEAEQRRAA